MGAKHIAELTLNLMPPLCEEGRWVTGNGNVLSHTMCRKHWTILNTCRWFWTTKKMMH